MLRQRAWGSGLDPATNPACPTCRAVVLPVSDPSRSRSLAFLLGEFEELCFMLWAERMVKPWCHRFIDKPIVTKQPYKMSTKTPTVKFTTTQDEIPVVGMVCRIPRPCVEPKFKVVLRQ